MLPSRPLKILYCMEVETGLYDSARSFKEYSDLGTLKRRIVLHITGAGAKGEGEKDGGKEVYGIWYMVYGICQFVHQVLVRAIFLPV